MAEISIHLHQDRLYTKIFVMIESKNYPHRKRNRKKNFSYSSPESYFLTICCHKFRTVLGTVNQGGFEANEVGQMVDFWWHRLPAKFNRIQLHESVIMPNHMHGIIQILPHGAYCQAAVGKDPRVLPSGVSTGDVMRKDPWVLPYSLSNGDVEWKDPWVLPYGTDLRVEPAIPRIIQWFKTMSTNEFFRIQRRTSLTDLPKLWQISYYDNIIRSPADFARISDYIRNNPRRWNSDRFRKP